MKIKHLCCLLLLFTFLHVRAQESPCYYDYLTNIAGNHNSLYLMLNQVLFDLPDGFYCNNDIDPMEFLNSPEFNDVDEIWPCHRIYSDNKDFILFLGIEPWCAENCPPPLMNEVHESSVYCYLRHNAIKAERWTYPIHYHTTDYARRAFNADTVISFPLEVWGKPYKRKYKHALGLTIQKNGRSFIQLTILYTDKGRGKLDSYLRSLEKMIWYRDPEDFLDFRYEEPGEQVIVRDQSENKKKRGKR